MDKRTLTALQASIEHWEKNAQAEVVSNIADNAASCPLCQIFYFEKIGNVLPCSGCPVREKTRQSNCYGSPWFTARAAKNNWKDANFTFNFEVKYESLSDEQALVKSENLNQLRLKYRKAARDEVDFLRSLLPEVGSNEPQSE
jgi:hypothetical protein